MSQLFVFVGHAIQLIISSIREPHLLHLLRERTVLNIYLYDINLAHLPVPERRHGALHAAAH